MTKISDYISLEDEKDILQAIKSSEQETSGEIRLHIEVNCPIDKAFERAKQVFEKLEMHKTKLRNGILIYVALEDHKLVIYGDKGINAKVSKTYWEDTVNLMLNYFRDKRFKEGLIAGITEIGKLLKKYFPYQNNDINELPNDISKN